MIFLKSILASIAGWFDLQRTKEDQLAGANKVKVAQYEEQDKIRDMANDINNSLPRDRLRRRD